MIHEGKTEVAIPSVRDDSKVKHLYEDWLFSYTDNHWANLSVTKDFTLFCYDRFIKKWMEKKGVDEVSAILRSHTYIHSPLAHRCPTM